MKVTSILLAATCLISPVAAFAQTAPESDEGTQSRPENDQSGVTAQNGIQDIVVTANRVGTDAQDTPIALNVYSGDDLRDQGINSVSDLTKIDPSVNLTNNGGAAYIAVRGIASTDTTEIGDPSVPITRDGFYVNRSFSINASMYDVARIEVLKGPQGTLNGRNSTGGLINIITNRPEMKNGGYASVDIGNYGAFIGEMGANLVIADGLAFRASGIFNTHNGYRKLLGPARFGDDEDFASGRVQLQFNRDALSIWASYQHDSRDVNGDAILNLPLASPKPDFGDANVFPNNSPILTKLGGDRFRWEVNYDGLAGLNFTYAGGYDKQDFRNRLDATGPLYDANRQFRQSEKPSTWNHEVRVSNDQGNRLFFQAGYFHFQEENTIDSGVYNLQATGPFAPGGPLAALAQPNQFGIKFDYNVKTRSDAVFGQIEYQLTDTLQASLGARYTWDRKDRTGQAVIFLPALSSPFAPPLTLVTPGNGKLNESQPTWHAGLTYKPSSDSMIYAKYDRGYKSGGFNSNGSQTSVPYGPEKLDAFEIGTKNSLMGNRLQINADVFYSDYRGYQASQTSASIGGGAGTFNVGSAKIYGAEGEITALLGVGTKASVNATYLHTKFGDGITVADGANVAQDIGGNELPNAPAFTVVGSLDHEFVLPVGSLTARVDGKYSSSFYYSVFNNTDTQSDDYFIGNASLTFAAPGGWKVQGYVKNIFDKAILAVAARNYVSGLNTYQFQAPRTYGVRFSAAF